jgi:sulfur-carrier protein
MVAVTIWGTLRAYTDGKLLDKLSQDYPGLKPQIKRGVSLALDGRIYREAWFTEIKPDSEVVLMPYMQGG